jgi:hypothetical protein
VQFQVYLLCGEWQSRQSNTSCIEDGVSYSWRAV